MQVTAVERIAYGSSLGQPSIFREWDVGLAAGSATIKRSWLYQPTPTNVPYNQLRHGNHLANETQVAVQVVLYMQPCFEFAAPRQVPNASKIQQLQKVKNLRDLAEACPNIAPGVARELLATPFCA